MAMIMTLLVAGHFPLPACSSCTEFGSYPGPDPTSREALYPKLSLVFSACSLTGRRSTLSTDGFAVPPKSQMCRSMQVTPTVDGGFGGL